MQTIRDNVATVLWLSRRYLDESAICDASFLVVPEHDKKFHPLADCSSWSHQVDSVLTTLRYRFPVYIGGDTSAGDPAALGYSKRDVESKVTRQAADICYAVVGPVVGITV